MRCDLSVVAMKKCIGITIDRWGPCAWNTLHAFAHTYPNEPSLTQKAGARAMLYSFADFLPCPKCRVHFQIWLDQNLTLDRLRSRKSFVAFMNEAHNAVNARLGKKQFTLQEHYDVYSRPQTGEFYYAPFVFLGAVILCVVISKRLTRSKRLSSS